MHIICCLFFRKKSRNTYNYDIHSKYLRFYVLAIFFFVGMYYNTHLVHSEVIVLAAPPVTDNYYAEATEDIIQFQIEYAKKIIDNDDQVIIFSHDTYKHIYADAIGKERVVAYSMQDIWMRDFSLSYISDPVLFRYTSAAQGTGKEGQQEADFVQDTFFKVYT